MHRRVGPLRIVVTVVALAALVAVIAWPVLAADPSGSPSIAPSASASTDPSPTTATPTTAATPTAEATAAVDATAEPAATAAPTTTDDDGGTQMPERPPKPDKDKADKAKGDPVTVSGTVGSRSDEDGRTEYTLTNGSTVLILDAGPSWFYGEDHPLASQVGTRVTVVGTQRAGESEVDVETVDGVAIRAPGKPPWAGGWKVVGEVHPGWSAEKAERWAEKRAEQAKRHGASCWPPGQCKDATAPDPTLSNPPGD